MNKAKKRAIILGIICLVILIGALIVNNYLEKDYLVEIKYDKVLEKVNNKDSFVLLLSQTTCSHCASYKPKLRRVANNYKLTVYYLETDLLNEEQSTELKKYFNFDGTPTTVFVINGYEKTAANRINGDVSEQKIINKLKSNGFIK